MSIGKARPRVSDRPVKNYYTRSYDAHKYLHQSIMRYKGRPALVVVDGSTARVYDPSGDRMIASINLNDEELDLSPPRLGYINILDPDDGDVTVRYCERAPIQAWKQGITAGNILFYTIDGRPVRGDSYWMTTGFVNCLENRYPPFDFALSKLKSGEFSEVAVSRSVAFSARRTGLILAFYRGREFGYIRENEGFITAKDTTMNWTIKKNCPQLDIRLVG